MLNLSRLSVLTTAAFVLISSPLAFAQRDWDAPRIVTWNCSGCHGVDGNAQSPSFPRLAGLNSRYAEKKIAKFQAIAEPHVDELFHNFKPATAKSAVTPIDERIDMIGMAHAVNPAEAKSSAQWYAKQQPTSGHSGKAALVEQGELLFLKGQAARGTPPCQACHGVHGEGNAEIPRLAGQNDGYLMSALETYKKGDPKKPGSMAAVVQNVSTEQFRALAAYLQSL